jgi:hypothetical protein
MTEAPTLTIDLARQGTNRKCGSCTLCCRLLPVGEVGKPANVKCGHQFSGGCRVYHKAGFPRSCAIWSCQWLVEPDTSKLKRPDRSGYVVDNMPDIVRQTDNETGTVVEVPVVQVWCDPARPDAWTDPALLTWAKHRAETEGTALLVRFSQKRATIVYPPAVSPTGQWCKVGPIDSDTP